MFIFLFITITVKSFLSTSLQTRSYHSLYNVIHKHNIWQISLYLSSNSTSWKFVTELTFRFGYPTIFISCKHTPLPLHSYIVHSHIINTLRTGDADLRFYITTVQDGWRKSAFLTCACFPYAIDLIIQYIEPVSEWSCRRMFIETWPHSELTFRHRASSI